MLAFKKDEQITLEDYLKGLTVDGKVSSQAVLKAIDELSKMHEKIKRAENAARIRQKEREKRLEEEREKQHVEDVTSMDLPLDYENAFANDDRAAGMNVESVSDGLVKSLNVLGKVEIEYIAKVTGLECKDVITLLKGAIYQNPAKWQECFYKGWETADEYLAGNLLKKWREAKEANDKYNGYFSENLKALEQVLPKSVASEDVIITLGSPWVPTWVIDDFIEHLFGKSYYTGKKDYCVRHDEMTGTWDIPEKSRYYNNAKTYSTYGTSRIQALYILERTLNMRNVSVTDEVTCLTNKSGKTRVVNQQETVAALEKQKKLIDEFQKWVWKDPARKERLMEIYEEKYSSYRVRRYDGRFLEFPNMNNEIILRPHQRNAIARMIFSKNTLLAHDVGSGKTYAMIAAGVELKRMGLSTKNLFVVPNNLVGQWQKMFLNLYKNAKVLVVAPKDFTPIKRQSTLIKMKHGDYDGIIIASSCFDVIPLSKEYYNKKFKEIEERLNELQKETLKNTSGVKSEKKKL